MKTLISYFVSSWRISYKIQYILIISTTSCPTSNFSQMPPPPPPNCTPSSVYKALRTANDAIRTWMEACPLAHRQPARDHTPDENDVFPSCHQLPLALSYGWTSPSRLVDVNFSKSFWFSGSYTLLTHSSVIFPELLGQECDRNIHSELSTHSLTSGRFCINLHPLKKEASLTRGRE